MSLLEPNERVSPAAANPGSGLRADDHSSVFLGPLGLRAGWGILAFFLLAIVLAVVFFIGAFKLTGQVRQYEQDRRAKHQAQAEALAQHRTAPPAPMRVKTVILAEASESGAVLGAGLVLGLLERRRFRVFGLALKHLRDALPGALCGLVAISVLVGLLRALHVLVFDGRLLSGREAMRYGAAWLAVFLLVGVFEEFFFRGYIQYTLTRGLAGVSAQAWPAHARFAAFWIAAVIWSLLFCVTHLGNAGEDPMGVVMVFVAGIVFSYALWRTGSLWWGIGFHMTWDWGQSFLYGVPDSGSLSAGRLFQTHPVGHVLLSGGVAGPEGSVLVLPVLALVALVIRLHPQAEQPPLEPLSLPPVHPPAMPLSIP